MLIAVFIFPFLISISCLLPVVDYWSQEMMGKRGLKLSIYYIDS